MSPIKSVLLSALIAVGIMAATVALALFIASMAPAKAAPAASADVDVELVLVVDISSSIDEKEFALQRLGLATAFSDPAIIKAIKGGAIGRIAVTLVEFGDTATVVIPWRAIHDDVSAQAFADLVTTVPRSGDGETSISAGITLADKLIASSAYRATRRVIDVSGDGSNNKDDQFNGITLDGARALATALKITINGLPIQDDEEGIADFYRDFVLTGPGAFIVPAADSADFARAIRRKLIREIS